MRVERKWTAAVSVAGALALLVSGCGSNSDSDSAGGGGDGGDAGSLTVTVGKLPSNAAAGFLDMAVEKKMFAKYGLTVNIKTLANASELTPALISGTVDMIDESPGASMVAIQKGVLKAKVIGSSMPGLPWAIYSTKDITSVKQLAGKSMAVSSATGLPRVVAQLILQKNGVDPTSVKYVNSGANANRYKAVVTGTVDSASIPSDFAPQAKKDGVNVLAYAAEEVPEYPRFTIIARSDFLKDHAKAAEAYLAGIMEGERYAFDHPDEAKALAAKALGGETTADSPIVTNMYDQIVKEKLVNRNAEIPMSMITYLQKTLIDIGLLTKPLDLNTLYDDQYRQAALKLVKTKSGTS